MTATTYPFVSMSCADPRLNLLLTIFDGDIRHQERKLGGGLTYCVNPFQLESDIHMAESFEGVFFKAMIVLSHDDCAAQHKSRFFQGIALDQKDEIGSQLTALKKLKLQFPDTSIDLYFGVINTEEAQKVTPETSLDTVLDTIITWVDDEKPPRELFEHAL